jgi:hypothetical protein
LIEVYSWNNHLGDVPVGHVWLVDLVNWRGKNAMREEFL